MTIHEAAATTGWSPRMLRYIEETGLVEAPRSAGGYRLYGPGELQRLRTLRELLGEFGLELNDVGFALRLRADRRLQESVDAWLAGKAVMPGEIGAGAWLSFEKHKHMQLLAATAAERRKEIA